MSTSKMLSTSSKRIRETARCAGGHSVTGDGRLTVRDADDDWLLIWQMDDHDPGIVRVRYRGLDPFA
jgi:hypothetical protein